MSNATNDAAEPLAIGSVLDTPPADDPVVQEKRALRRQVRKDRQAAYPEATAAGVNEQLQQLLTTTGARRVAAFLATPLEPQTVDFLAWARTANITVLLPLTRDDGLLDWVIDRGNYTFNERLNIPEPLGSPIAPIQFDTVDLVLCPAALVAENGGRLGWGGGFYDRMLGSTVHQPPVFAVIHDRELVAEVPLDAHDMPVNGVVTPTRCISFAK